MKFIEILKSDPKVTYDRVGDGPYLFYDKNGKMLIAPNFQHLVSICSADKEHLQDIDVYAYGFKKDEYDTREYANPNEVAERFNQLNHDGVYECVREDDVPTYCDFATLEADLANGEDYLVNGVPLKQFVLAEKNRQIDYK